MPNLSRFLNCCSWLLAFSIIWVARAQAESRHLDYYRRLFRSEPPKKYYESLAGNEPSIMELIYFINPSWITIGSLTLAFLLFAFGQKLASIFPAVVGLLYFTLSNWMYVFFALLLFSLYVVLSMDEEQLNKRNPFKKLAGNGLSGGLSGGLFGKRKRKRSRKFDDGDKEDLKDKVADLELDLENLRASKVEVEGRKSFNPFSARLQ